MKRAEAQARILAATTRISSANWFAGGAVFMLGVASAVLEWLIHLGLALGLTAQLGISAWFGLPLALVSDQTLGRFWFWLRSAHRVEALEAMAAKLESAAAGRTP